MSPSPAPRAVLQRAAACLLLAAGFAHAWAYRVFQPDDTFIFLVYAKNLLAGHGLTFNGERVEGFSSLLWTLLVAAAGAPGFDLLVAAKAVSIALYLVIGLALARFASRIGGPAQWWESACLLAMFYALPAAALWASGAMETTLFSLLLLAACFAYVRASCVTQSPGDHAIAGTMFGLLAWTRPEGFAFAGAIVAFEVGRAVFGRARDPRRAFVALAAAAAAIAALTLWRFAVYGQWLPATVSAKTGDLASQIVRGKFYVRGFALDYAWLVVAYAMACVALFLRRGPAAWWAWMSLIVVTGDTLFALLAGGDWMMGYRFLVPLLPVAVLTIYLAARVRAPVLVAVTLLLATAGIHQSTKLLPAAQAQARSDLGDIRMGEYIRDLHLPPQSRIAVLDAGAIPYYSGLPTIDMVGLNDAHIANLPGGFMAKWDNDYVLAARPEVIQFHTVRERGEVIPSEASIGTARLFYSREFQRWYAFDAKSPVAHLFRRRAAPLERTFMDTFGDAQWSLRWDAATGRASVELRKTGDGLWPAPADENLHVARTFVRAQWLSKEGAVQFERWVPLPRTLGAGESAHLGIDMPKTGAPTLRVCAVLFAVVDPLSCADAPGGP